VWFQGLSKIALNQPVYFCVSHHCGFPISSWESTILNLLCPSPILSRTAIHSINSATRLFVYQYQYYLGAIGPWTSYLFSCQLLLYKMEIITEHTLHSCYKDEKTPVHMCSLVQALAPNKPPLHSPIPLKPTSRPQLHQDSPPPATWLPTVGYGLNSTGVYHRGPCKEKLPLTHLCVPSTTGPRPFTNQGLDKVTWKTMAHKTPIWQGQKEERERSTTLDRKT
jgi:hypothetical protein